jgi:hypothetical protein
MQIATIIGRSLKVDIDRPPAAAESGTCLGQEFRPPYFCIGNFLLSDKSQPAPLNFLFARNHYFQGTNPKFPTMGKNTRTTIYL